MLRKALAVVLLVVQPACAHAQPAAAAPGDYQALLDQYIRPIAAKGEPFDTRFDYEQLYVDEKIWTQHRSARLEAMHAQMLSAKPSAMTPGERLAWGINTYNFLVIERVSCNLLIPGRGLLRYKNVDELYARQGGFFASTIAVVEGRDFSLDAFQRRFVFGDTTTGIAPRAPVSDPRLLFATNPGRIGSPPLQPQAYRADALERQLDLATRTALALPRFVSVKPEPPLLLVSDWLGRKRADLGGTETAMLEFVKKWAPREVRDGMRNAKLTRVSRYTPADASLNQVAHPKVIMKPGAVGTSVIP